MWPATVGTLDRGLPTLYTPYWSVRRSKVLNMLESSMNTSAVGRLELSGVKPTMSATGTSL